MLSTEEKSCYEFNLVGFDYNKVSHSSAATNLEKQNTHPHCTSDALEIVQVTTTKKPKTDTKLLKNWKGMEDRTET